MWSIWENLMVQPSQTHNRGKNWHQGESLYFRFDDDNKMKHKYILSIVLTPTGQLNNPIYWKKANREN